MPWELQRFACYPLRAPIHQAVMGRASNAINLSYNSLRLLGLCISRLARKTASSQNGDVNNPFRQEAMDGPHYPRNRASVQGRCRPSNLRGNDYQDLWLLEVCLPLSGAGSGDHRACVLVADSSWQ